MLDATPRKPEPMIDDDLTLVLIQILAGDESLGRVPAYRFEMKSTQNGVTMGSIDLRLGDSHFLTHYAGQIGYGVSPFFRGQRYAARSVKLLLPLARSHGIRPLWITCNPDNWPSRKTCEHAGATLVEVVDLPSDCEMYERGERQKCRYRIDL